MLYAAAVAAAMLAQVAARPMFYDSVHRGCTIPDRGYAGHPEPQADPAVTIIVMKDGEPVTEYTPGESYTIESAAYGSETVNIWVHATGGQVSAIPDPSAAEPSHGDAASCTGSASFSFMVAASHEFGWTAPTGADCVMVSVAQAAGMSDHYHTATVEVCPGAAGKPDAPMQAPKATAPPPTPVPTPVAPTPEPAKPTKQEATKPDEAMAPWPVMPRQPPPAPPAESPTGAGCGQGGQPVCAGDDLVGREFECDYGYVGEAGICVDFMDVAMAPSGPDCGMMGQPACNGVELDGREFECDYGYVAEDGICVEWMPDKATPSGPDCGKEGQVVCAGVDLVGREFECDFGFVGENGVCVPYAVDENKKEEEKEMKEEQQEDAAAPAGTDSEEGSTDGEDETKEEMNKGDEKSKM